MTLQQNPGTEKVNKQRVNTRGQHSIISFMQGVCITITATALLNNFVGVPKRKLKELATHLMIENEDLLTDINTLNTYIAEKEGGVVDLETYTISDSFGGLYGNQLEEKGIKDALMLATNNLEHKEDKSILNLNRAPIDYYKNIRKMRIDGSGDCEDFSLLTAEAMHYINEDVYIIIGKETQGGQIGGHVVNGIPQDIYEKVFPGINIPNFSIIEINDRKVVLCEPQNGSKPSGLIQIDKIYELKKNQQQFTEVPNNYQDKIFREYVNKRVYEERLTSQIQNHTSK